MGTPDFLVVGHITRDLLAGGSFRLGGTAGYAAVTAARLGYQVAVYTSTRPDLDLTPPREVAGAIHIISNPAPHDTVFFNYDQGGRRWQRLLQRALPLSPDGLPEAWRSVPLVLLGPVAQEVSPDWVHSFPQASVGGCLQGWLRA